MENLLRNADPHVAADMAWAILRREKEVFDMMQTLTKQELSWIYKALEREAMRNIEAMNQCEVGSPAYYLAELGRDNARSTMHKVHTVLNEGSKRIQIK